MRVLLDKGDADPKAVDVEGRTPIDYASISEAIWPFFAGVCALAGRRMELARYTVPTLTTLLPRPRCQARGCRRSHKAELIVKGIIRKINDQPEQLASSDKYSESVRRRTRVVIAAESDGYR